MEIDMEEYSDVVSRVAKFIVHDFPNIELEDVEQELWLWLCEQVGKGNSLPTAHNLPNALRLVAKGYAWNLRKQQLHISDQYSYRTSDVRRLLDTLWEKSSWDAAAVPADAISELGNDGIDMSCDLMMAFEKLNPSYKIIIFRRFALNDKLDTKDAKYLSTAISRLATILNTLPTTDPSTGKRVTMGNSSANHQLEI